MSNAVASLGPRWVGDEHELGSGSMKRRMSHAHAVRSTCGPVRVAHFTPPAQLLGKLLAAPPAGARAREVVARSIRRARGEAARACGGFPPPAQLRRRSMTLGTRSAMRRLHPGRYLPLLRQGPGWRSRSSRRRRPARPHRQATRAARGCGCQRQRDEAVEELRDAEPPQLPPHRDPRRGRLPR